MSAIEEIRNLASREVDAVADPERAFGLGFEYRALIDKYGLCPVQHQVQPHPLLRSMPAVCCQETCRLWKGDHCGMAAGG